MSKDGLQKRSCPICDARPCQPALVRFPSCDHRVRACCATKLVVRAGTLACPHCEDEPSVTTLDRVHLMTTTR